VSKPSREFDLALLESELKGKTLLVYWHLLKSSGSRVGVREVQRKLGFSSPSVAVYHLDKLMSLGLVEKTVTGEYVLISEVKTGLLRFFTRLGRFLVPRYLFYSVWFTTMLISYIIFYGQSLRTQHRCINLRTFRLKHSMVRNCKSVKGKTILTRVF